MDAQVESNDRRVEAAMGWPVGVGFGIRDAQSAAAIVRVADAVAVGTVPEQREENLVEEPETNSRATAALFADTRSAMDGGT